MQVQDALGNLRMRWVRWSPHVKWRIPLWVALCVFVCASTVLAAVGLSRDNPSLWMGASLISLFVYTATGLHLLLATRHTEYLLFDEGVKVKQFWNAGEAGPVRAYWWEEFAGYAVQGDRILLQRKGSAPVVIHCGENLAQARQLIEATIPRSG